MWFLEFRLLALPFSTSILTKTPSSQMTLLPSIITVIGLVFIFLIGACLLMTSSLLVTALIKEKHNYILPFFLVEILMVLMNVSGFVIFFIKMFSNPSPNGFYMVFLLINGGLCFYFFTVVYSYYREATWSSTIT